MNVDNEYFCHHPWVGVDITPQGEFKPCCKYSNVIATSIDDYFNSSELKKLKQTFNQGGKPQGCKRCWDDEDAGILSKRQLDQKYFVEDLTKIRVLSLPFGNSCNLACRICSSYASSTWGIEEKKLSKYRPVTIFKHQRFYQDKEFIEKIKSLCGNVVLVEFPGGEPFIAGVQEHLDFLDFLIECGSTNTSLHYITNATVFPNQEFWTRWNKFKNVDIQLSIDGLEQHFEYNRWPASWKDVLTNLNKYVEQRNSTKNLQLSVSHTVSIFNVYYLPEFVKWCLQNKLGMPYLGLLSRPQMYNIKSLPLSAKDRVAEKLGKYKFENVVSFMYNEQIDSLDFEYIKILDQHRNQNFSNTFPEFSQLLKESGCQI